MYLDKFLVLIKDTESNLMLLTRKMDLSNISFLLLYTGYIRTINPFYLSMLINFSRRLLIWILRLLFLSFQSCKLSLYAFSLTPNGGSKIMESKKLLNCSGMDLNVFNLTISGIFILYYLKFSQTLFPFILKVFQ